MDSPIVSDQPQNHTTDGQHWQEPPASGLPLMLNAKQVAQLLAIRRPQVYTLAREGIIPSVRVGRTIRFNRDHLLAWIDAGGTGLSEDK
jgi:excisionase family DNA binding protein